MPTTIFRKYARADHQAIMHADGDWKAVEGVLSKDMATVDEYLQTWKLKLSTTKTVLTVIHINKEAKCQLKVNQPQKQNPALLLQTQLPRSNVGQIAHVSPTPWVTSQEADMTRRTLRGWLWLWFWSNDAVNSHPSPGTFNSRVLHSCLVPQCSYLAHWPCHQQRFANCGWMPAFNFPILMVIQPT